MSDYNKDTWDDLMKYVKKRTRGKTEDKIAKVISARDKNDMEVSDDGSDDEKEDEIALSDDEMKHDDIKTKKKKGKKKKATLEDPEGEKIEFSEVVETSSDINTFYQMNLSRPLMKAIGVLGFTHPTPIQSMTIPIALLARDVCGCGKSTIRNHLFKYQKRKLSFFTGEINILNKLFSEFFSIFNFYVINYKSSFNLKPQLAPEKLPLICFRHLKDCSISL